MGLKPLFNRRNHVAKTPELLTLYDQFLNDFQIGTGICPNDLNPEYQANIQFLIYDYNGAIHTLSFTNPSDTLRHATYIVDSITYTKEGKLSILLLLREIEK